MTGFLKSMLSETGTDQVSSTRFVFVAAILIVLCTWSIMSIRSGQIISFDVQDLGILLVLMGGKVANKAFEEKKK